MKSFFRSQSFCVALLCLGGALVGCEEPLNFGQVSGTVTLHGKPLEEVLIMFLPEPEEDKKGAHSECVSDSDGKYQLVYSLDANTYGAILGRHRVVIQDFAAENARGKRLPVRIHSSYSSAAHTPLKVEVTSGEQTHDFDLNGRR